MTKRLLLSLILMYIGGLLMVTDAISRQKRFLLIYPKGVSKVVVITGFGIPVDLEPETVIVGTVFKGNYRLPQNSTELTNPIVTYSRKKRSLSRWDLYKLLEQALEIKGFNGKSCLLRAICEVAHSPLVKNLGLFHEIVHKFLTPTSTKETPLRHSDNEYYAAEFFGSKKKNCEQIFNDCPTSFVDLITVFG